MARATPFGDDNSKTHVVFLAAKPAAKAVRELTSLDLEPDRVEVVGSDVFLHYPNGVIGRPPHRRAARAEARRGRHRRVTGGP